MAITDKTKPAGFTLIEMVMTIVIFSMLSVIVGPLLLASYKNFTIGNAINAMSMQALIGVERIVYDLRNASSITTIANNSFTFVDQNGVSYTYALSNGALQRGSYTLLNNGQSITFTYLDQNGVVTAVASAVSYVKINLSLLSNSIPLSYTTLVSLKGMS